MYHRFSEREEFGKTSRAVFERHLEYLTRNYRIISLTEAADHIKKGDPPPPRSAVITVDDGYRDFYEVAYPALRKFSALATVYVVTGFVSGECWIWTDKARYILSSTPKKQLDFAINGRSFGQALDSSDKRLKSANVFNSELKKIADAEKDLLIKNLATELRVDLPVTPPGEFASLTWQQVQTLSANGIEIGSHTVTHPILTNVNETRLKAELEGSRVAIQNRLQVRNVHFCYPNGDHSIRELEAAKAAAYASAVTTEIKLCDEDEGIFALPRIDAEPEMHRLVQATSGFDVWK